MMEKLHPVRGESLALRKRYKLKRTCSEVHGSSSVHYQAHFLIVLEPSTHKNKIMQPFHATKIKLSKLKIHTGISSCILTKQKKIKEKVGIFMQHNLMTAKMFFN